MKKISWPLWMLLTLVLAGYFGYTLLAAKDKSEFLIGKTSYGHYQIELACSSCHTEAFGGPELIQDACVSCHGQELKDAHDSHPKKKFTDPREAYRLEILDARYCVSCHTEHKPEQTHAMGVTLPDDYCFHCHVDIGKERESHKDLPFDSCASAGCHNFHDNRALYESFLVKNANQPWLKDIATIASASSAHHFATRDKAPDPKVDLLQMQQHPEISEQWQHSSHAAAQISCTGCHSTDAGQWLERPGVTQCQNCHQQEANGFLSGKHGMRLAGTIQTPLAPISPAESPLAFKTSSMNARHGCNSCHQSHIFDTQFAATDACLQCHNDEHTQNFLQSPHGKLWKQAKDGVIREENAVSCATCHLPRVDSDKTGTKVVSTMAVIESNSRTADIHTGSAEIAQTSLRVEHNQNLFLRPNEKMIRPVCMRCHSLEFAIDSLADSKLIKSNFNGKPGTHIPSMDWAQKRDKGHKDGQED